MDIHWVARLDRNGVPFPPTTRCIVMHIHCCAHGPICIMVIKGSFITWFLSCIYWPPGLHLLYFFQTYLSQSSISKKFAVWRQSWIEDFEITSYQTNWSSSRSNFFDIELGLQTLYENTKSIFLDRIIELAIVFCTIQPKNDCGGL